MKLARVLSSLSLSVLAIAGPIAHSQANVSENEPSVIYVDAHSGSDSNSGSSSSPLKTIQAAVHKANTNNQKSIGTKIIVNAGVYRETVSIAPVTGMTSAPLTIQAATAGTAIISASDVLTGWSADPQYSGAYVANWTPTQTTCALPSGWPAVQPIVLHTEILFVNGVAMTQVLAYSDLKPGTFFVRASDGTVHMWPPANLDPSSATVEVGTRTKTMSVVGRSNIVLRGLVFEHANSCINTSGATITTSTNVLVDAVQSNWNNWGGLGVFSSSKVTVQNSVGSYNGGLGFQGTRDQTILYSNNETDYNNWRGAQGTLYDWASGGAKLFQMRTTTVQGHSSYNNQAQGLWFDTDNQNITIDNATLVGSYNAGLQLERNQGPITLENSHLCSSGKGLNVLTTQGLTVKNNVFYNNGATNKYEAQFYLAGSAGGINITNWQTGQVYNLVTTGTVISGNTFIDAAPGQFVFGTYLGGTDWTDFTSTLKSGSNTWYDSTTSAAFRIVNGKNVDLPGWQNATGADYNSAWTAPASSPASECAAPQTAYPDFNVSVDSSAYTMSSGRATATVRVNSFNFGAVNLSVSGLPAGVTASFSKPTLTSGYSILTLTASSTSAAQTVPVNLWAVSGDRVHSATIKLTVNANPAVIGTTTTLSSSASTVNDNSLVTLTASVKQTSGSTAPSGSVTFYSGAMSIGTASLSGGTASLSTSSLPIGQNSITAEYGGNSTFNASTSSTITVNVISAAVNTTTTLTASASSVAQNSPVTFNANVKPSSGTSSATGTITFYNGATILGTATLSAGSATFTTSSLPTGSNSITAVYSGASSFNGSTSAAVSVSVSANVVSTTATLIASSSTITENSPVTLTATVKQNSGPDAPTGTVTFYNGTTLLGSATLSGGTASISTSALPVGTDSVSAAYSGAVTFNASSSNVVAITVNASSSSVINTVTTIAPSTTSITQASPLTLVVNVKQASGTTAPSGGVTVYNGSTIVATGSVTAGTAILTIPSLPAGTDILSASYAGTTTFSPSISGPVAITVNPAVVNTSTGLIPSASSITANSQVTFTANVKQASGTTVPSGSVNFYNRGSLIGTTTMSAGVATMTTSALPVGANSISAAYAGSSGFNPSASGSVTVTVNAVVVSTSTTLTASSNTVQRGSALSLTANVKATNATASPTGTVTFLDGPQVIGTAALSSGVATLTISTLPAGNQTIVATYAGTTAYGPSSSNAVAVTITAPGTQTPSTAIATNTSLTSSVQQADQGFTIALSATVKPTNGSTLPTGSVEFISGKSKLGSANLSGGKAYLTTSSLPAGNDFITATYVGNSSFAASTSPTVTVKILGADFKVEATPSSVSTVPGKSVDVSLLITPMNGFNQSPSMVCAGLPAGSTCSFGAPAKQADGTSIVKMTIHTAPLTTSSNSVIGSRAPLALAFLPLLFWISSKRRKEFRRLLSLSMLVVGIIAFGGSAIGCGGHATSSQTNANSTTVSITVSAQTSTGLSHSTSIALTLM